MNYNMVLYPLSQCLETRHALDQHFHVLPILLKFSLITIIGLYSVRWLEIDTTILAELSQSSNQATQIIYNDTHASHFLT